MSVLWEATPVMIRPSVITPWAASSVSVHQDSQAVDTGVLVRFSLHICYSSSSVLLIHYQLTNFNPFKPNGVIWLHFIVFRAILV